MLSYNANNETIRQSSPTIHPSLTCSRIMKAVKRSMFDDGFPGFCTSCGRKAKQNCEPDARDYPCLFKSCGKDTVFGAEELLCIVVAP